MFYFINQFLFPYCLPECNMTICDSEAPPCDNGNRLVMGYSTLSCCPEYRCGENKLTFYLLSSSCNVYRNYGLYIVLSLF